MMATTYSSAAVIMGHLAIKRAIRYAEASDLVARNAAAPAGHPKASKGVEVADPPAGRGGHHRRRDLAGNGTALGRLPGAATSDISSDAGGHRPALTWSGALGG